MAAARPAAQGRRPRPAGDDGHRQGARGGRRLSRILLLNGASSSGKSTLARGLQGALDAPFLHLASDQLVDGGAVPPARPGVPAFDWVRVMRPRFFDGFHRCIRAMADGGNDLIVDHIIEFPSWRVQLAALLEGLDVFLVGVHCDPAELERRELARGDRRPGEALEHIVEDRIHELGAYDVEVDTTAGVDAALVERVLKAWRARSGRGALFSG